MQIATFCGTTTIPTATQLWGLGTLCTHGCMPAVAVAIRKRQRGLFYRLALDKICCFSGGKAKSSRFVNRQGHALLFRPEALPNLARPPRAWPSFVPSSCRKTKFCSIKCKAGCAHHQEARPSFVPSSSGKTESCSIVQGQSQVLFFQEEDIPRVSGHYEERFGTLVPSLVVVLKQKAFGPNEVEISSQ